MADSTSGLEGRIKRLSLTGLIVSAAVVLVVGLIVGLGVGYKIEQSRTKDDIKKAKAQTAAAKAQSQGSSQQAGGAAVRLVGKVGTTSANTVSITVGGKTTRRFVMDGTTVVVKATPAKPSDITSGSRIVWKAKSGQQTVADEVIVLTSDAKLGTDVVSATPTSMTIKENGKNVTVDTSGATVEKAEAAKATDIATGDKVLAQTRRTNASTLSAIEVIVLPSSSKFVV